MRRMLEKLRGTTEAEFNSDNYLDAKDSENEELKWLNEDELYETAEAMPESVVNYGVESFVRDGEFSLGQFTEALEEANQVWQTYREQDEHNPRTVSKKDAMAYGAGAADPSFITNSPRYSEEVEEEVNNATENMANQFEETHSTFDTQRMMRNLLGPEETAQAELILRDETDVYNE